MLPAGFKQALKAFQRAAETVPAYQKFLKSEGINPAMIKTPEDFEKIPYVDKKNYLRKYEYQELFPFGHIPEMVSASSGSSGKPFYWPRSEALHTEGAEIHARIFTDIFGLEKKKTLVIVSFSMGMWIAGTYTLLSLLEMQRKNGLNISIATPGIEVEDTISILRGFAKNFDAIVFIGYPPFIMDLIKKAQEEKINLNTWDISFLFAGEQFSEVWREYVYDIAGVTSDLSRSVSIYGTADAGIVGHETPATVAFRKSFLRKDFLHTDQLDQLGEAQTLVQYYPKYKYLETHKSELLITSAYTGIPLIRYNIHDQCVLVPENEFEKLSEKASVYTNFPELRHAKYQLPVVALYGRKDIAVMFYALIIYPQNIKAGLEEKSIAPYITGKFIAEVVLGKKGKQNLRIHVELAESKMRNGKIEKKIQSLVIKALCQKNAEYRKLVASIGKQAYPKMVLHEFGSEIFKIKKSKHNWVKKAL